MKLFFVIGLGIWFAAPALDAPYQRFAYALGAALVLISAIPGVP